MIVDYSVLLQICVGIRRKYKLAKIKKNWRKVNRHNRTVAHNMYDISCVSVGRNSYGAIDVMSYNPDAHLYIGNFCSISEEVKFLLGAEHNLRTISTYPFKAQIQRKEGEALTKGDIIIGDDVMIGFRTVILSGVHIGQGAVIAAGAVVASDVPPYAIAGGVPARIISYRFSNEIIDKLLAIKWDKINDEFVINNIEQLYQLITEENIDKILEKFVNEEYKRKENL